MKLRGIVYALFIAAAAGAFAVGSSTPGQAKTKMAAPPPHPGPCFEPPATVCGKKGGMMFSYENACFAEKDGAAVISKGACPKPKAHKMHHKKSHKKAKKMAKPAKKTDKKKM